MQSGALSAENGMMNNSSKRRIDMSPNGETVAISATNQKPFRDSTVTGSVSFVGNRPETSEHMEHAAATQRGTKKTTTSCKAHHDNPRVQRKQAGVTSGLLCSGFLTLSSFTWLLSPLLLPAAFCYLLVLFGRSLISHRDSKTP